jgi:hypothetical protein
MKNLLKISLLASALAISSIALADDTWTHSSNASQSALRNDNVQQHLLNTTRSQKHSNRSTVNQNLNQSQKEHLKAQENVRLHSIYNSK